MYWRQVVSQAPVTTDVSSEVIDKYIDSWEPLNQRMLTGSSFSGHERNCAFLNTGNGQFADVSATSGLNYIDDGRSIAVTDWDQDGDLDLWITNRTAPRVRFLRNDGKTDNRYFAVQLQGDPKKLCPLDAFGARVEATFKDEAGEVSKRIQTLYGGDSFLSQSTKWLNFGVRPNESIEKVTVRWPGSLEVEQFQGVEIDGRVLLVQGKGVAIKVERAAGERNLEPSDFRGPDVKLTGRLKISWPKKIEDLTFKTLAGNQTQRMAPLDQPALVLLWASWCPPCIEELTELSKTVTKGVEVIALNIETGEEAPSSAELNKILDEVGFRGTRGLASPELIAELNQKHLDAIFVRYDLPLPVSFLIDTQGLLRVVYKGILEIDQMQKDVETLDAQGLDSMTLAVPFPGRWTEEVLNGNPAEVAKVHIQNGNPDDARTFLTWYLETYEVPDAERRDPTANSQRTMLASVYYQLGRVASFEKKSDESFEHFKSALVLNPDSPEAVLAVISYLVSKGKYEEAKPYAKTAANLAGGHPRVEYQLGLVAAGTGDAASAIECYRTALEASGGRFYLAANNLAWILATHTEVEFRDGPEAVKVAKVACEATGYRDYRLFSTLGAAYAEAGDFAKAIEIIERGIGMAKAKPDPATLAELNARLIDFKAGRPHRE